MSTPGEQPTAIERLNNESALAAERLAFGARSEAFDLAFDAVAYYLADDEATYRDLQSRGFPVGESVGLFVAEDMLAAPKTPGKFIRTFGILLVDAAVHEALQLSEEDVDYPLDEDSDFDIDSKASLKIYVPIGDNTHIEHFQMPAKQEVDAVYLAYRAVGAGPVRIAISHAEMVDFDAPGETAVSGLEEAPLSFAEFMRKSSAKVDDGFVTAAQALSNIINMRAVPQRSVELGKPETTDF